MRGMGGCVRGGGGSKRRGAGGEGAGMHWGPLKSAEKPCHGGRGVGGQGGSRRSGRSGGGEHALGHVHGPWGSMGWSAGCVGGEGRASGGGGASKRRGRHALAPFMSMEHGGRGDGEWEANEGHGRGAWGVGVRVGWSRSHVRGEGAGMHWGPLKSAEKPCPGGPWGSRGRRPGGE